MTTPFAAGTRVSVEKTQAEIKALLAKHGATRTAHAEDTDAGMAQVEFFMNERRIRFMLQLPGRREKQFFFTAVKQNRVTDQAAYKNWEQACRTKWRALLLCIKAKLEAVQAGISEFDDEFMPNVVMPNGQTVSQIVRPQIKQHYLGGPALQGLPAADDTTRLIESLSEAHVRGLRGGDS